MIVNLAAGMVVSSSEPAAPTLRLKLSEICDVVLERSHLRLTIR